MQRAFTNKPKYRRKAKAARQLAAACEPLEHRQLLSAYGPLVSVASFVPYPNGDSPAAVTFDSSGNIWGVGGGGPSGDGTIYEIAKGSSTPSIVASFNGTNGNEPEGAVAFDASGNLWGTTFSGGSFGNGTIFEIAKGNNSITSVASFNYSTTGATPFGPVTFDASGNLWGATLQGGPYIDGTVYELVKGTNAISDVANFDGSNGDNPRAGVNFDSSGNLWGTTSSGGSNSDGTVYEIAKGSNTITTIANFNGSNGRGSTAAVTFDTAGNLWGTSGSGGASGVGTVFEIVKGSNAITTTASFAGGNNGAASGGPVTFDASGNLWGTASPAIYGDDGLIYKINKGTNTITTVANFNGANGVYPSGPVTFDTSGNLWGTVGGAPSNSGSIFEVVKGGSTIKTVASFFASSGATPDAAVTFDSSGNLWGTTSAGGLYNDGTIFEIAKGTSTVNTVAVFNGSNGADPLAAVTFDASGNLWGTTYLGGTSSAGTVFEITKGSSTITSVASFNGSNGLNPKAAVTFDASGNLWGTTYNVSSTTGYLGTVFEIAKGTSTITTVAGFNGTNGEEPSGVTFDASGNLWGTTYYAYSNTNGTVFEIVKGSSTITTVAAFNVDDGTEPEAGVTFDANGNLWGTTSEERVNANGTVFEIAKGTTTITNVASFNGTNGKDPLAAVTFDTSGNLWGTTFSGGTYNGGTVYEIVKGTSTINAVVNCNYAYEYQPVAGLTVDTGGDLWGTNSQAGVANAGNVWELSLMPNWLSDPAGNDTWNTASHTLIVNDPSTIIADPGTDQPIIQASGSAAVVTINPSGTLQIHLGGLSLTNGASAIVTSLGAARTATNHRALILGQAGATSAPMFNIDPTSKLDLTDNDLVDHDGSLSSVSGLLASGFKSGWSGNGIVSSEIGGSIINALGVSLPASAGTFDGETVGTSDVEIHFTYYGDANLDGHVDGSDYSKIDSGFLNISTGWSNGDFNFDGVINGSDYTLIDNAFNTQGATLAALVARSGLGDATKPVSGGKAIERTQAVSFVPRIFSTGTPIALTELPEQSVELAIHDRDLLDQLSLAR